MRSEDFSGVSSERLQGEVPAVTLILTFDQNSTVPRRFRGCGQDFLKGAPWVGGGAGVVGSPVWGGGG